MDNDSHHSAADRQVEAHSDPLLDCADSVHPVTVDLQRWALTPAQRSFIQSFLSEDDDNDTDR